MGVYTEFQDIVDSGKVTVLFLLTTRLCAWNSLVISPIPRAEVAIGFSFRATVQEVFGFLGLEVDSTKLDNIEGM